MSTGSEGLAARRAAFRDALRRADLLVAARAAATVPILPQSRGRVIFAVAAAPVVAQPQATVVPDPVTVVVPSPAGSPAPAGPTGPTGPTGPIGATGASGPTASGGPGTGGPSATPSVTPTATPPRATPLPPLALGFARLTGQVVDAQTGRGVPGACVSLGPCTSVSTQTDAAGRWTLDLPVGSGRLDWGLEFAKAGYLSATLSVRSRT